MNDTAAIIGIITGIIAILAALYKVLRAVSKMRDEYKDAFERATHNDEGIKVLTKASFAILDGLKQQGCNGRVSEMHAALLEYVVDK